VFDISDGVRRGVESYFSVSVVFGVERQSIEFPLQVVPQDSNLTEASVEGFGGWSVDDVSQSEDIIVGLVLKGDGINVKVACGVGQACVG
jgi:hypothetical protein